VSRSRRYQQGLMSRTQTSQPKLQLQDRLALHALRLKEEAQTLGPGAERDAMIQRARQAETASQVDEWLMSPSLRPPR
jgi:hypothetical protein